MTRRVHLVVSMVGLHYSDKVLLVEQDDFCAMADELMADHSTLDAVAFKVAVVQNIGAGNVNRKLPKWEDTFLARLQERIRSREFSYSYKFEGAEASGYIEDFLEAYQHNYQLITYVVGPMHDGTDEVVTIVPRRRQSLAQRLMKRDGDPYGEINLLKSGVIRLAGSSLAFEMQVGDVTYWFNDKGLRNYP